MAMIVRIEITDDATGEVKQTFVQSMSESWSSWEAARAIRELFKRMFALVYGEQNDEW